MRDRPVVDAGLPGPVSARARASSRSAVDRCRRPAGPDTVDHATTGPNHDPGSPTGVDSQRIQMLIGLIATGGLDEHLPAISSAIGERHRQRHRAQSNQAAARIDIGARVRLNHDIRPLYLHGATGTVVGWAGQSVVVQTRRTHRPLHQRPDPLPTAGTRTTTDLTVTPTSGTRPVPAAGCNSGPGTQGKELAASRAGILARHSGGPSVGSSTPRTRPAWCCSSC
jgi:hypothetical protein